MYCEAGEPGSSERAGDGRHRCPHEPELLYQRARVSASDERVFCGKLLVVAVLVLLGGFAALSGNWPAMVAGFVVLGAVYTHAVELQHQCLHHSAFTAARPHRIAGIVLGIPLLVSYSHYRVRHLQHHKFLGTPQDSEFFGFDTRRPLTFRMLLRGLFDYGRLLVILREIVRSYRGTWTYDLGPLVDRRGRQIISEYHLLGAFIGTAAALSAVGFGEYVLKLWVIPLAIGIPLHFLVELPEHILCDTETTNVLRNTRTIKGSWFTTWFTNGNNLHVEHHAAMSVPINRLRERHAEVARFGEHVERTYLGFFHRVLSEARRNTKARP
ncbi:fatty acid desaturase family protein [Streptomyces sioyaensis]|uniref:fatty acid desaturase family protein n=1 Tax=Streptomyces sioyaensis TaxID=67364 RepID=UPI003791DD66